MYVRLAVVVVVSSNCDSFSIARKSGIGNLANGKLPCGRDKAIERLYLFVRVCRKLRRRIYNGLNIFSIIVLREAEQRYEFTTVRGEGKFLDSCGAFDIRNTDPPSWHLALDSKY